MDKHWWAVENHSNIVTIIVENDDNTYYAFGCEVELPKNHFTLLERVIVPEQVLLEQSKLKG